MVGCRLTPDEVPVQRERYRRVAQAAISVRRSDMAVTADLRVSVDRDLVAELVDVERACCPFFDIGYDDSRNVLSIAVREREHVPALDVVAEALGAT